MMSRPMAALAVLAILAGCDGATEFDHPPGRGISADIDAAHFRGSSLPYPGMTDGGEPVAAYPWQLDERQRER